MEQYVLDLKSGTSFRSEDYIVTDSNRAAVEWIQNWPDWGNGIYNNIIYIFGEEGSGKTHLSRIWGEESKAVTITEDDLAQGTYMSSQSNSFILENLQNFLGSEVQLFHFINHIINSKKFLMVTGNLNIRQVPFCLKDLKSRLESILAIEIKKPDEKMIECILMKYFSDRQVTISHSAIQYLVARINFSYKAIMEVVNKLDKASLAAQKNISIPFIKSILNF